MNLKAGLADSYFSQKAYPSNRAAWLIIGLLVSNECHSGKAGVSPVGFVRANIRYRQKPTSNFTSFMRVQLNVGTRALYETNVSYRTSDNEEGSGVVKNRATGFLMAFGLRYEFINF